MNGENGSENQATIGTYGSLLMDSMWTSIPCVDLLALADAAFTTNGTGGGLGDQCGGDSQQEGGGSFTPSSQTDGVKYLFDLNAPPAVNEPQLITSIPSALPPITPKQTRRVVRKRVVSDILNSDIDGRTGRTAASLGRLKPVIEQSQDDIWQLEVNDDFDEESTSSDELLLLKTPKPKRRKHRPKVVKEGQAKKSTTPKPKGSSTGKSKNITPEKSTVRPVRNSCRRKIYFEEETMYEKAFSISPITPNKSEIEKDAANTHSRAKRNLKFSKEGHEKEASYSSTLCTAEDNTVFPAIFKKKRTEKCYNSVTSNAISFKWSREILTVYDYKNILGYFGDVEIFRKKRSKGRKRVRDMVSFAGLIEAKNPWKCMEALAAADFSLCVSTKKRTKKNYSIVPSSSYHNDWSLTSHLGFLSNVRWKSRYDIDALINQFNILCLNDQKVEQDQHALVPYLTRYQEKNGLVLYQHSKSLVPFEDEKIMKTRPKVDLDDETSRVWRLLLEDINSEGIDGTDEDNTKFWEEERSVFSGRAASFIARMHLIQGDRRFSRWKGSVVDSVIGVFLTQNVSDHLSSSAFINLAARYPLRPKTNNEEEKSSITVKEPFQLNDEDKLNHQGSALYEVKEVEDFVSSVNTSPNTSQSSISVTNCNDGIGAEHIDMTEEKTVTQNKREDKSPSEQSEISEELKIVSNQETKVFECQVVVSENLTSVIDQQAEVSEIIESNSNDNGNLKVSVSGSSKMNKGKGKTGKGKKKKADWDSLRKTAQLKNRREKSPDTMDSVDYEAVRRANVNEISDVIKDRGMNNMLAERIKGFLNRLVKDHGSIDLEWLRDVPPDKAKEYLLSFRGLGLKSVECVRLLTLHHLAFPVDTNVGRIAVRLGWVPLQPLPESLQLHLLEMYPVLETIQQYLWPRLCKLDQRTLYELHYQMITFGKVFCTKNKPNCNSCPMRGECRHFASAFASSRLALPASEEKRIVTTVAGHNSHGQSEGSNLVNNRGSLTLPPINHYPHPEIENRDQDPVIEEPATPEPIIEVPTTPEPAKLQEDFDIEDFCEEIPMIKLNMEAFTENLQNYMENNMEVAEGDKSRALVALTSEAASIPTPKLKNVSQLRTEHQVYELPDSHPLLEGLDKREPDDPCSYLLAIWTPGETAESIQPPKGQCISHESGKLCRKRTCFWCNSIREANSQTVRGTILIPCRTAMRGSFPLNGTYFQVNEVFADHESSLCPIDVPRCWLWNLPRRTVYFGTSIPTIFRGLTTEGIQYCFWRGFVCVRGFDQKTRSPRPLMARLHFPASKLKASSKFHD
ncbi:DNA glycosylase/AP lyase ROS1-like isoform X2 [Bidens hawaiensis]|uniref:DNA glycosylase/AP lyase ROS1-like isoform X2 n=1 Tax=Bidens hawaiensis TaxID=980011 RepID=UPI00404B089D